MKQTKTLSNPKITEQIRTEAKTKSFEMKWWLATSIFLLFTVIFFWDQLIGNAFFWEDFAEYVYPIQTFAAREFANGIIPFWNPYAFVGMPFLADIQVGFFYPFNRLLSLFVGSDGNLSVAMLQFMVIIHFLIAQLAMYFTAKHFKVSSFGSIIAAVSYSFSFLFVCHVIHPMIVSHLAWFPLILMFLHKAIEKGELKSGIYAGLLYGMIMLSGHPQMTLFIGLFLGAFLLWFVVADFIKGKYKAMASLTMFRYLSAGIIPFIIALGLFQIQFLPSQELAGLSKRNEMSFEKSAEGSIELEQVFSMVVPKIFGYSNGENTAKVPFYLKANLPGNKAQPTPYYYYWETSFYFGIAAIILGLFAMLALYKERLVAFLIAFTIFAFIFALGSNGFLLVIFHELPFFSQLRIPARMMFGAAFAFSLLAGVAFDHLTKVKERADIVKLLVAGGIPIFIGIGAATGILPSILGAEDKFISELQSFGTIALIISIAVLSIAFLRTRNIINPSIAGSLLVLIVFIDLYVAGGDFNVSKQSIAKQYELPAATLNAFRPKYPNDIFRVNMRTYNPSYMAMKRNQGLVSGIELIEGYNPLLLNKVQPPLNDKVDIHYLFNVKYEIAIDQERGMPYFAENKNRAERAYFVNSAVIVKEAAIENFMRNNKLDYSKTVILEEPLPFELPQFDSLSRGKVKITEYKSNKIILEIDAESNGVLCLSEIYYPAWQAKIDGKPAKIYRSNFSFRALAIEKGKHTIEMEYSSSAFATGFWLSLATLFASILSLIVLTKKKK